MSEIPTTALESLPTRVARLEKENIALRDAAENVVIAFGMGWDLDGVIAKLQELTHAD